MITETFGLFLDDAGAVEASVYEDPIDKTDESNNPTDYTYWLMSLTANRILQATSDPGTDDIVITPTDILPVWQASHAYILDDQAQPVINNGYRYIITTAGTSGATTPTFPTGAIGNTVVDGTAVWTLISPKHEIEEVLLSLTEIGLDSATPGMSLNLGNQIDSLAVNAVEIWVRRNNNVNVVSNNSAAPEVQLTINNVTELTAP